MDVQVQRFSVCFAVARAATVAVAFEAAFEVNPR
jgi:hypothetical protein